VAGVVQHGRHFAYGGYAVVRDQVLADVQSHEKFFAVFAGFKRNVHAQRGHYVTQGHVGQVPSCQIHVQYSLFPNLQALPEGGINVAAGQSDCVIGRRGRIFRWLVAEHPLQDAVREECAFFRPLHQAGVASELFFKFLEGT